MATFDYKALTLSGLTKKGTIDGDSSRHVRQLLRDKGLTPLEVKSQDVKKSEALRSQWLKPKIQTQDLTLLTRQLYTLLEAGMPLTQSLKAVSEQSESKLVQKFLSQVFSRVVEGHSLAQAMQISNYQVSEEFIATIRAGEESGHLEQVLSRLADSIEQQAKLNKKLKAALVYPSIMVIMSVGIVFFLMIFVVPKVVTVFDNMDHELPALTQNMLAMSEFMQTNWLLILVVFAGLWVVYKVLMKKDNWKTKRDSLLLSIPVLGRFLIFASSARWARTTGVLLASGVAVTDTLKISSEVMTLLPLKNKILAMGEQVRQGNRLQDAMKQAGFFPALLLNLVQTGEGSGKLDVMLLKGASHYESEVESSAATLVSLIEPIMIIVMGGVVMTIVLAIMLPIFEMNQMV
jgi:general secretion pathway protein F